MRFPILLLLAGSCVLADDRAIAEAVAAMQRGDFVSGEKLLRAEVAAHPNEAMALSLLGVALDGLDRGREASGFHLRAVAAAPRNADVLSNFGNHLAQNGDEMGAKNAYLRVISGDLGHKNANLQLIRLALRQRKGEEAAKYLGNLTDLGDVSFPLGVAFAEAGEFARAEDLFARALAGSPDDFNILVNLGAVSASAGHFVRAREAFDAALRQQPENIDVLVRAAQVDLALRQPESAIRRLAKVDRADAQKLLALATSDVGALDDSLAAWDRYVKLATNDEEARRERGFTAVRMGQVERGVADLRWYLERHPEDPIVHYQLGVAEQDTAELDRAIALKPDFAAAMSARGGLHYQQGKLDAALKDLEAAVKLNPDALTLDRLGQTYSGLERPADAVRVLRRAAELAPNDSKVVMHLARALGDAGLAEESKAAMERFKQLGPAAKGGLPAGLVDYLAMTPEQQKADYRARVEKAYRESPDDPTAQVHYLKLLLDEGKDASEFIRRLKGSGDPRVEALVKEVLGRPLREMPERPPRER
jgi:tetratricopeptide (TPR) repeat protein